MRCSRLGRLLLLFRVALLASSSAQAALRVYGMGDPEGGPAEPVGAGYAVRNPALTPSVQGFSGALTWGRFVLEDDGGGAVVASELSLGGDSRTTINVSSGFRMAPIDSYFFIRTVSTATVVDGGTGAGSTAAGSQIDWGIVSGWVSTGSRFCRGRPAGWCTLVGLEEDASVPFGVIGSSSPYIVSAWEIGTLSSAVPWMM